MLPRHRQILEYVRQHGDASVDALARVLGVTTQTIRRDIRQLEDERLLARYHGGVGLPSSVENIDYDQRQVLHIDAKRSIAEAVARHVEPGRSLIINIGTTTEEISKALVGQNGPRGLRVITNNLNVASILSGSPDAEVIVAGGLVRNRDRGIVGEATIDFMKQFRVDIGIIGVSSIDEDGTLLDYDYREVRVAQAIIEQSREVWLAADHSKFGRRAVVRLGHISQIDKFFTDVPVPEPMAEVFRAAEVDVVVASEAGQA
ncbi:HTH domain protein [Ralstonia insidiosa]|uniref:HTH domain protein n=1 Tax=Ralstonia insidiosa TaxID=190721 RepID=A0AAC9FPP0_9RALS|nr:MULTISPECIES: DeoR/GlpR family DNA-binding transcription regulator [Ralstonia]ANH71829.1 HTH domain protein [Ralstonia insidiosa]EPX95693.1 DeoR faimly transcriptional regulator [Ralstonia sp. AU12-08]MBY4707590.1 DeoR/GlpR family DNA-binding transcription regulator [Ralstonia insidiosa]